MVFRKRIRAAALLAPVGIIAAALAVATTATPASAKPYPPPSIHLLCTAAANSGTLDGSVCALPFGVTTAPNSYSAPPARPQPDGADRGRHQRHR